MASVSRRWGRARRAGSGRYSGRCWLSSDVVGMVGRLRGLVLAWRWLLLSSLLLDVPDVVVIVHVVRAGNNGVDGRGGGSAVSRLAALRSVRAPYGLTLRHLRSVAATSGKPAFHVARRDERRRVTTRTAAVGVPDQLWV